MISQLYSNLNTKFIRLFNFVRHSVREAAGYISHHGEEMFSKLDYKTNNFGQFIIICKLKVTLRVSKHRKSFESGNELSSNISSSSDVQTLHSMAFRKPGRSLLIQSLGHIKINLWPT